MIRTAAATFLLVSAAFVTWSVADSRVTSESCPHDVSSSVRNCLDEHNSRMVALQRTETHFMAGVDVENLRALCHQFLRSLDCVRVMQDVCPRWKHQAMDDALRPYVAVFNMCTRPHFIEEYSMVHNCFYIERQVINTCYRRFTKSASSYEHHARQNHHSAVRTYCQHVSHLETCVKNAVRRRCGDRAAYMMSVLVDVSADLSYKCSGRHRHHDSSSVTTKSSKSNQQGDSLTRSETGDVAPTLRSSQTFAISVVVTAATAAELLFGRLFV